MKYCPNCLKECSMSKLYNGGYACEPCGILQYATGILLDTPDTEKQKMYKLEKLLDSRIAYDRDSKEVAKEIMEILSATPLSSSEGLKKEQ